MSLARLDPRIKIFILLSISTTALIMKSPLAILSLLGLVLLVLLAGGINPAATWLKIRGILGLIATLFLIQCIFNRGGDPLLIAGGITLVTQNGLDVALLVSLRLAIIVLSALIVLTGATRDYLLAMTQCRLPYEIAFMVLAALRFIPILRDEAQDVLCAVQMRGMRLKNAGLQQQAKIYISIVLPVVAGAIRRAEHLSVAMEARAFRAYTQRTDMRRLSFMTSDWLYLTGYCLTLAAVVAVGYRMA